MREVKLKRPIEIVEGIRRRQQERRVTFINEAYILLLDKHQLIACVIYHDARVL